MFLYYLNKVSDDVISCTTKTVKYWLGNTPPISLEIFFIQILPKLHNWQHHHFPNLHIKNVNNSKTEQNIQEYED